MAENQDGQEKVHEPTAKRLSDARTKGQVPRSKELNTMALTLGGVAALWLLAPRFTEGFHKLFAGQFTLSRSDIFDPHAMIAHLGAAIGDALLMLLPFMAITVVLAVLSSVALGGFNVSFQPMKPTLSKLSPLKGLKRMFGVKGLMELAKAVGKFLLVGSATVILLYLWAEELIRLGDLDVAAALREGMILIGWSGLLISSSLIVVALIDVPFQLWQHKRELKMTHQEVRDELKDTEGKPEVKSQIRKLQNEMARRRMMEAVPQADVIVTNPTHYAVALRYDPDRMRAPIVVAKGRELVAANIRRVGETHRVPLIEAPVLARAIYFSTELQQPIPAGLFLAVAQLLAYVFQLRAYRDYGGDIPQPPQDFPVPEEYRHD